MSTEDNPDSKDNFWFIWSQKFPIQINILFMWLFFCRQKSILTLWATLTIMVIYVADNRQFRFLLMRSREDNSNTKCNFRFIWTFPRPTRDSSDSNIIWYLWYRQKINPILLIKLLFGRQKTYISDADQVSLRWEIIWADRIHYRRSNKLLSYLVKLRYKIKLFWTQHNIQACAYNSRY